MKFIFHGYVEKGKLSLYNRNGLPEILPTFEGMEVSLTLQERKTERTQKQNRYYWGVVIPLVRMGLKELGYRGTTKEATHKLLKSMFLKEELVNESSGEVLTFQGSTANLSTQQFTDYIDEVVQFAAEELSVDIPQPNEQMEIEY